MGDHGAGRTARPGRGGPAVDLAEEFDGHRSHLIGVAYRMLGSIADAEDAVQEAWLRLRRVDRAGIDDLRAWLTTVTGRLCLDRLRAVRATREVYVGPWLPEPLVERLPATDPDPADAAVLADSVRMALLLVLEQLTPEQRVAFVLHDVFGVPFDEVARTLSTSPEAARQAASRARRAVHDRAPRRVAPPAEQRAVLDAFVLACRQGDLDGLLGLLAPDVVLRSDGGGAVRAALRPIEGADKVARFLVGLLNGLGDTEVVVDLVSVNGTAGMVVSLRPPDSAVAHRVGVYAFDVSPDGRIDRLWFVLNPAKLGHLPT